MSDFLLIVFVIILLFSVFRRFIFFFVINALTKGLFKKMQQQQQQQQNFNSRRPEGEVRVEDNSSSKPGSSSPKGNIGDYVDYEEIKD